MLILFQKAPYVMRPIAVAMQKSLNLHAPGFFCPNAVTANALHPHRASEMALGIRAQCEDLLSDSIRRENF